MRTSLYILAVCAVSVLLSQYALGTFFKSHKRKVPRSVRTVIALAAIAPLLFLAGLGGWHTWNSALSTRQTATIENALNRQATDLKNIAQELSANPEVIATIKNPQSTTTLQTLAIERSLRTVVLTDENGTILASPLQPEMVGVPSPYASFLPSVVETVGGVSTTTSQKNISLLAFAPINQGTEKGYLIATKDPEPLTGGRYGALIIDPSQLVVPMNAYKLDSKGRSSSLIGSVITDPFITDTTYRIVEKSWYAVRAHKLPVMTVSNPLYILIVSPTVFPLYVAITTAGLVILLLLYIVFRRRVRLREVPGVLYLIIFTLAVSTACIQVARRGFYNRYSSRIDTAQPVLNATLGFYGTAVNSTVGTPVTMNILFTSPGAILGRIQGAVVIDPPGSADVSMTFDKDSCPIHAVKNHENDAYPMSILCIPPRVPFAKQDVVLGSLTITPRTSAPFTVGFDADRSLLYTTDSNQIYTAYPPVTFISK